VQSNHLQQKIALITGGGRGIGAGIARKLASLGATAIISARNIQRLEQTAREIRDAGGRCEPMSCDMTDWNSVTAISERIQSQFGRLDILVNNAGVGGFGGPLHNLPVDKWDNILNTNLRGVFYMIRAFVPLLINAGGGHIINISSIASKNPLPNGAAYAASKWGLNGLSYSVAEELRGQDIRVSVVCPGSTHTELSPHEGKSVEKMLQPDDIAHAVAMLVTQAKQSFVSEVVIRPTQKP
jgi:NAD(P)-dependent dehydrogenase (short-subunit alcohol dehydrogenase family)